MGAGVSVETVRFYKREGLLEQPARRPSGYREVSEEVVPEDSIHQECTDPWIYAEGTLRTSCPEARPEKECLRGEAGG